MSNKSQQEFSAFLVIIGSILGFSSPSTIIGTIGAGLLLSGLIWFIIARIFLSKHP